MTTLSKPFQVVFLALLVLLVLVVGCGGGTVPDGVEWEVMGDLARPQFDNRVVDIRINKRVSENTLQMISQEVRDGNPDFGLISVRFYLPGTKPQTASAWAVTMFDPDYSLRFKEPPK